MLTETLKTIFNRDLTKLKQEIESYQDEKTIWTTEKGITNSAGNLCLHLIGNLNTFIGAELGKTNYVRHRELEFSLKDVPRDELIQKIQETKILVESILEKMTEEQLEQDYPIVVFESKNSTAFFLVHLTTHLAYHLGQINYHRRLLDS